MTWPESPCSAAALTGMGLSGSFLACVAAGSPAGRRLTLSSPRAAGGLRTVGLLASAWSASPKQNCGSGEPTGLEGPPSAAFVGADRELPGTQVPGHDASPRSTLEGR